MRAPLVLISPASGYRVSVAAPRRYTACGITWDVEDIVRFLGKCVWERHIGGDGKLHICLVFTGARSRGKGNKQWYGSFRVKGKTVRAHKFFAVAVLGLRPGPGDELDHKCYNTRCVSCLECVTREVNQSRIRRRSTSRGKRDASRELSAGVLEEGRHHASPYAPFVEFGKLPAPTITVDLSPDTE